MDIKSLKGAHLGSGLIGIGRIWGAKITSVPSEKKASNFLDFAKKTGIFYFDTAPSYGKSEERLGKIFKYNLELRKK